MKYLLLSALMLGLVGCKSSVPDMSKVTSGNDNIQFTSIPPESEIIAGLNFESKKRGLRWDIFCVPKDELSSQHYLAAASYKNDPLEAIYAEDGAREKWLITSDTPLKAGYALYLMLATNQPANDFPDHKPIPPPAGTDVCNYNDVYDSEHAGKIPCSKESK